MSYRKNPVAKSGEKGQGREVTARPSSPTPQRKAPGKKPADSPPSGVNPFLGSTLALAMGIFVWLGHRWDVAHDRSPLGVVIGLVAGLLFGAYEVWKLIRQSNPPDDSA